MSRALILAVALLLVANTARAADPKAALAILDRAIAAHGGVAALNRSQTLQRTASGVIALAGEEVPFTEELTFQLPNRLRWNVETGTGTRKTSLAVVVNGDRGWQLTGGAATELSRERLQEMRDELLILWLATLTPIRAQWKAGSVTLDVLPETQVAERPAVGIKVLRKLQPEVRLYFDRETSLLVKLEREAKMAGQPVPKETLLGEHKAFDGVKLPAHLVELADGKKMSESKSVTYRLLDKVDEGVFGKP